MMEKYKPILIQYLMSDSRDVFLKCQKLFVEDPDNIRAKREEKKKADDKMRALFVKRNHDTKNQLKVLERARLAKEIKPKTKDIVK